MLDENLAPDMRSLPKWKASSNKKQKIKQTAEPVYEVKAEPVHEVKDVKDAEPTQPVLAEPALAAEQAHEVKDAEPTQLAEPAVSQFSPPTPVPPFPSVSPSLSVSRFLSPFSFPPFMSPPQGSPAPAVSPIGGHLCY